MGSMSVNHLLHVAVISFENHMCMKRRQNGGRMQGSLGLRISLKWRFGYFWSPSLGSQCLVDSIDGGWQVHSLEGKSSQILTHGHQCLMWAEVATNSPMPFKRFLTPNCLEIEQGIQFTATTCQYYYNPWLAEHHSWNMPTTIASFCQCRSRYWFEECLLCF